MCPQNLKRWIYHFDASHIHLGASLFRLLQLAQEVVLGLLS